MRQKFWVLGILLVFGCGRNTDFLYQVHETPAKLYEGAHKLKELQGESQVDMLWIVDNSGSMGMYHNELIKNADDFITLFTAKGGLEWKMGLISTAIGERPYLGFGTDTVLHSTPGGVDKFKKGVRRLGTGGDVIEKTFAPMKKHISDHPDFLRKRATLAIIMVTDAPEQSGMPAKDIIDFLKVQKGDIRRVVSYGVFASNDLGCRTSEGPWKYYGSPYEQLIKTSKGKVYKLCENFGKNLADLAKDLVTRVQRPFILLKDRPDVKTLRVSYKGRDLPPGQPGAGGYWVYDYELNRVTFHSLDFAPSDNEEVVIAYEVADTGSK